MYDNACVFDNAKVYQGAKIYNNAKVYGNADVSACVIVGKNACIFDNAKVFGLVKVYGKVYGNSEVSDLYFKTIPETSNVSFGNKKQEPKKFFDFKNLGFLKKINNYILFKREDFSCLFLFC